MCNDANCSPSASIGDTSADAGTGPRSATAPHVPQPAARAPPSARDLRHRAPYTAP